MRWPATISGGLSVFRYGDESQGRRTWVMFNTRSEDPTGLSSNNVSTASDLARMVAAAHRYPLIREFSTTSDAKVVVSGRLMEYRNTNQLEESAHWDIGLSRPVSSGSRCRSCRRVASVCRHRAADSQGKLTRIGDANRIKRWME